MKDSQSAAPSAGRDEAWTVLGVILSSAKYLEGKGVGTSRLDAEHLLAHVLGVNRLQLYLDYDRPLAGELDDLRPLLRRRATREPLQYILGRQPFRTLDLIVDPAVLIPRPETELLVDQVLDWASSRGDPGLSVLDVGTGSGAIALALAEEGSFGHVVATDVSAEALSVARRNRSELGLDDRVEFREGVFFEPIASGELFDVVVSNPPYVAEIEAPDLEPELREWEPAEALFGGQDGLDAVREIVAGAGKHLRAAGLLALEVGAGQTESVAALLRASGDYDEAEIRRDLTGRNRFVLARRASPG